MDCNAPAKTAHPPDIIFTLTEFSVQAAPKGSVAPDHITRSATNFHQKIAGPSNLHCLFRQMPALMPKPGHRGLNLAGRWVL